MQDSYRERGGGERAEARKLSLDDMAKLALMLLSVLMMPLIRRTLPHNAAVYINSYTLQT